MLIVDEWSTPRAVEWYLRAVLALKDDFAWCSQLHCSARKKGVGANRQQVLPEQLNQLKTEFTELKLCAQLNLAEINHQFNRDVKWSSAEIEAETIMVMKYPRYHLLLLRAVLGAIHVHPGQREL